MFSVSVFKSFLLNGIFLITVESMATDATVLFPRFVPICRFIFIDGTKAFTGFRRFACFVISGAAFFACTESYKVSTTGCTSFGSTPTSSSSVEEEAKTIVPAKSRAQTKIVFCDNIIKDTVQWTCSESYGLFTCVLNISRDGYVMPSMFCGQNSNVAQTSKKDTPLHISRKKNKRAYKANTYNRRRLMAREKGEHLLFLSPHTQTLGTTLFTHKQLALLLRAVVVFLCDNT